LVLTFVGFRTVKRDPITKAPLFIHPSPVEQDHCDGDDLIVDNKKSPELVEIVFYYASGYLCRRSRLLKSTKCEVYLH